MKSLLKKIGVKNLLVITLVLLIGVVICLDLALNPNVGYDNTDVLQNATQSPDDNKILGQSALVNGEGGEEGELAADSFFAVSVIDRQRARDEAIETLQSVVDSAEGMPDVKDKAMEDIASIAANIEQEANIETLVKSKGFEDCVAVISSGAANIIVKTEGLMPNEVSQIKEIVYEQTGIKPTSIKIIEKYE